MDTKPARRRTKILATLNPEKINPRLLENMISAGMDASRHNMSHGDAQQHIDTIKLVREISENYRPVGVVVDLQGPKLRILDFVDGKAILKKGEEFILDAACAENAGTHERVGLDYPELVNDVKPGDTLALADGFIKLTVKLVKGTEVICEVLNSGVLFGRQGINKVGGGLSAPALTDKDREDVIALAPHHPDFFALSFVKSPEDIRELRELIRSQNCNAHIIAKIECREAIDNIRDIILEADVIMIARGDLGVEMGDPHLPGIQKKFIRKARTLNSSAITATQMMETMITNPIPTRAEVFDVANAVLDGTDVVMLSGETAKGKYPVDVIAKMNEIICGAEQEKSARVSHHRPDDKFLNVEETIAMSAMYAVNKFHEDDSDEPTVRAIIALTESGHTAIMASRISSGVSIFALSPNIETVRRLTIYRGVYPMHFVNQAEDHEDIIEEVVAFLCNAYPDYINKGDKVLVTKGPKLRQRGGTNSLTIATVK
jgi:pyruvate kinase